MKLWKYYLIPEKDVEKRTYRLYAFTNKKEFAERFEEERSEKHFIYAKPVEIEKDEWVKFAKENRDKLLDYHGFETKGEIDGRYVISTVKILCTDSEFSQSNSESVEEEICDVVTITNMPSYKIFNKKIIKALRLIQFTKYYKLMSANAYLMENDDDYSAPEFSVDELACYIKLFHYLYKYRKDV